MKDPLDYFALEDVKLIAGVPVKQTIASERDIIQIIKGFFGESAAERTVRDCFICPGEA